MAKRLPVRNRRRHEGKTGVTKFKELCMDTARSGGELGRFWASVTGCSYVEPSTPDESGDVIGGTRVQRVPSAGEWFPRRSLRRSSTSRPAANLWPTATA